MTKEKIEQLFDFEKYYDDPKYEVEMYDEMNLIDDEYIPLERIDGLRSLLIPLKIDNGKIKPQDIDCTALKAAMLLCSWGYDEGLEYLSQIIRHVSGEIGCYPHRLHPYDQSYEWILDSLFNYNIRYSMRGDEKIGLTKTHTLISKIISMAVKEKIGLSRMQYRMYDENNAHYFMPVVEETLQAIKDKPTKVEPLDSYNIEDLEMALTRPHPLGNVNV